MEKIITFDQGQSPDEGLAAPQVKRANATPERSGNFPR